MRSCMRAYACVHMHGIGAGLGDEEAEAGEGTEARPEDDGADAGEEVEAELEDAGVTTF